MLTLVFVFYSLKLWHVPNNLSLFNKLDAWISCLQTDAMYLSAKKSTKMRGT